MYLEIEDLASNALIELMKAKNERFVSYKDMEIYGEAVATETERFCFFRGIEQLPYMSPTRNSLKRERSEGTVGCFSGRESPRRI